MNIYRYFQTVILSALQGLVGSGELPEGLDPARVTVEAPRDVAHGDLATNAAMVLAKAAGKKPRELAELLLPSLLAHPDIASGDIAGPGFINLRLTEDFWRERLKDIIVAGERYGDSDDGHGKRINVEYVSANPTGPMHAGHVRGAVIGDSVANLLAKVGYDVTREYYFNDAGSQVDVLARSTYLRYREALGEEIREIPEGLYPGEYLRDVGRALATRDGANWLNEPEEAWLAPVRDFSVSYIMRLIGADLDLIGIKHDVFTNERELIDNGTLDKAFKILNDKGLIYIGTLPPPRGKIMEDWEPVPLTLFRSSLFGDSTDRPLKKRDGTWAYIMPDFAYHYDKIRRGFELIINVLGTDHGGYAERMRPAVAAFSDGKATLDVIFNGIVKIYNRGELVKLSKRSGNLITLREMVEQVGADAVRFFMLTRTPESELDFDFAKVTEQSKDNPVFYVQYAHARCRSVLRLAAEQYSSDILGAESLLDAQTGRLDSPEELDLIRRMAAWPAVVSGAAESHEPHKIAFYLYDLAAAFHQLWAKGKDNATLRFLLENDPSLTIARLALVQAVATVIASGLRLIGVDPAEELRS
jgi:arginyl-tRNA synthetase